MTGDSLFADEELAGNGAIGLAGREQPKHLRLAFAERIDWLRRGLLGLTGDARDAGFGSELCEDPSRSLDLERASVLVPPLFTDSRQQ